MPTVTIRRGDVMPVQKHQEILAQTSSGAISHEQRTKRPVTERHGHEDWTQRIERDWQNHLVTLRGYVCELARRNRRLRIASMTAHEPKRRYGNVINL